MVTADKAGLGSAQEKRPPRIAERPNFTSAQSSDIIAHRTLYRTLEFLGRALGLLRLAFGGQRIVTGLAAACSLALADSLIGRAFRLVDQFAHGKVLSDQRIF